MLASDVPGCRETLKQGESGFLFAPKNTESLEKAIRTFLGLTKEQREKMGMMGRQYVENTFDRSRVISAYFEEIQKAVNK